MERTCKKCKSSKELTEFVKNKECLLGYSYTCKSCRNQYVDNWIITNPDKFKTVQSRSYYKNKEQRTVYHSNYRKINKEVIAIKRKTTIEENRITYKEYHRDYKNTNRKRLIVERRNYKQYKLSTDPAFRIKESLRAGIVRSLQLYNQKRNFNSRTQEYIGCTFEFLKSYLEERFLPTMTWNNYGRYWHIDHIIPCSKFNLVEKEEQLRCFNYKNLQPLFAITQTINGVEYIGNLNKNNKILDYESREL